MMSHQQQGKDGSFQPRLVQSNTFPYKVGYLVAHDRRVSLIMKTTFKVEHLRQKQAGIIQLLRDYKSSYKVNGED